MVCLSHASCGIGLEISHTSALSSLTVLTNFMFSRWVLCPSILFLEYSSLIAYPGVPTVIKCTPLNYEYRGRV